MDYEVAWIGPIVGWVIYRMRGEYGVTCGIVSSRHGGGAAADDLIKETREIMRMGIEDFVRVVELDGD